MSITAKAIWYIEGHLGGDTSLEAVSEASNVSRYHLCRAFPTSTGHSLSAYVRGRRLSEAARLLAEGAPDILTVALDAGYGSHEAFTRAFHQHFGVTPEQLRAQGNLAHLTLLEPIRMNGTKLSALAPPRKMEGQALLLFGLAQRYSCQSNAGIPSQWNRFLPHFCNIAGQVGRIAYGVVHNFDEAGNYDYLCAVEVREFPENPPDFVRLRVAPQTYAVFEHKDHISSIQASWKLVWDEALVASGHKAADAPFFERYGENFDGRTGLGGVELWVPIRA